MKYELIAKHIQVWKSDIYLLPTIRLHINDFMYNDKTVSIEFHFLVLHARVLFVKM